VESNGLEGSNFSNPEYSLNVKIFHQQMNIQLINYLADDPKIKINFPMGQRGAVEFTWNPIYKYRAGEMLEEVTDVEYKLIYTVNEDINMFS